MRFNNNGPKQSYEKELLCFALFSMCSATFLPFSTPFSTPIPSSKRTCDESELQELGERLASDSRDALADHQRKLEDKAEAHLEAERKRLKDEMAGEAQ